VAAGDGNFGALGCDSFERDEADSTIAVHGQPGLKQQTNPCSVLSHGERHKIRRSCVTTRIFCPSEETEHPAKAVVNPGYTVSCFATIRLWLVNSHIQNLPRNGFEVYGTVMFIVDFASFLEQGVDACQSSCLGK
jgi:hypothetical protein